MTEAFTSSSTEVILSCPACERWQLHYSPDELVPDVFATGKIMEAVIETLLKEHVGNDCQSPQLFFIMARSRGVV